MALEIGSRIAHYDVTALIGEGGMGQVYQATDTKLKRQVALKILPEAFSADPERLARFQREAEVLASLNHPNIGAIYGLEKWALVLELIEGPTLADRIKQGPIPLDVSSSETPRRVVVMSKYFGGKIIAVACQKCGDETEQTVNKLENSPKIVCPQCGSTTKVNATELRAAMKNVDKALDDLKKTISKTIKLG